MSVTYLDGRAPHVMDVTDQEADEILARRNTPAKPTRTLDDIRRKSPHAYAPWTPEDEARLRELFVGGATPETIAAQMGRQVGGIRSRLRRLGLTPPG